MLRTTVFEDEKEAMHEFRFLMAMDRYKKIVVRYDEDWKAYIVQAWLS